MAAAQGKATGVPSASQRMGVFDAVRGFSVISMVLFHLCYDLRYLYSVDLGFFHPQFQDVWRASISWTFLFVAGCMCTFTRNAVRRAARYLACASAVFVATYLASVDTPISFGIIFCMGASTLVEHLLQKAHIEPHGLWTALLLFAAFVFCLGVPRGYIGIGSLRIALPRWLYGSPWFSWLGLPGPGFASGDYYPLLPYTLMFLCGSAMGHHWKHVGYPSWAYDISCPPLETVGRHALPIYIIHQPALLAILSLVL